MWIIPQCLMLLVARQERHPAYRNFCSSNLQKFTFVGYGVTFSTSRNIDWLNETSKVIKSVYGLYIHTIRPSDLHVWMFYTLFVCNMCFLHSG